MKKRILWYQIYYVVQVVVTVLFVAYYVMLAFKQREACEVDTVKKGSTEKENISSAITVTFIAGFVFHAINFTIGTFIEPCVRLTLIADPKDKEKP